MLEVLKELNVLYVDDQIDACKNLKKILGNYFKNVFIAHNGEEALEVYGKNKCHLLIVDYHMPIMDGYKFLSKIRENDDEVSAFMLSALDDKEMLKNAIKLNLLGYLVKPYDLEELRDILKIFAKHVTKKGLIKYQISKNCFYDKTTTSIINEGKSYKLTAFEVKTFEYLLKNKSKIIRYDELLNILDSTNQKSLISIIYKIKKKLPKDTIENVKDIGYKLN